MEVKNTPVNNPSEWQPLIIAFVCQWCTYTGADLAGTSRIQYSPNVRIIKLPCTGRIDVQFIIKAFEQGADGVLVSGCHPGDCHYTAGNFYARRRFDIFRRLLNFIGIDQRRVHFSWVSAAEGKKWADIVNEVTSLVKEAGSFSSYKQMSDWRHLLATQDVDLVQIHNNDANPTEAKE